MIRYLSVCSGIEAATVAWQPLGWEAVGFSEIEKFPNAVLQHHYPDVPNYGDMNDHKEWPRSEIDVLVGGTPCQSFSVAGLRAGMADPRGNLALVYLAIARRYSPTWLVWENVPGVLSSHEGRDFGTIVGAMVELGYGVAWRVLDAQYFGVPQRRRRVFVVGYLGDWRRAAEVLFEPACLRWDPAPSREAGQSVASALVSGAPNGGAAHGARSGTAKETNLISEVAPTIPARNSAGGGLGTDFDCDGGLIPSHDPAMTLTAREYKGPLPEADLSTVIAHPLLAKANDSHDDSKQTYVAFAQNQRDEVRLMDKAGALAAEPGAKQQTYVHQDMAVRRLTPLECIRLQGFPDNYFDGVLGRSDSQVYKALGNSFPVPVIRWIGERIEAFDGR